MNLSPKVKAAKIRRLYHSERRGLCDDQVLLDVGWGLHARCQDMITAMTGLKLGEVACPECETPTQRKSIPAPTERQRAALFQAHHRLGWFHCDGCQRRLLWQDCRDAMRRERRCFDCDGRLRRSGAALRCGCGQSWTPDKYRASLRRRLWLPCPECRHRVRRPTFERHPQDERIDAEPLVFPCSRCKAPLDRDGSWLVCRSCGHRLRARSHKKGLKRRNETLTCGSCGLQFRWLEWRSRAHECSSGNPSPAVQFLQQWPGSETSRERMMQVDLLIQALHGQGALAPVFIEGSPDSIRKLLDELAADA